MIIQQVLNKNVTNTTHLRLYIFFLNISTVKLSNIMRSKSESNAGNQPHQPIIRKISYHIRFDFYWIRIKFESFTVNILLYKIFNIFFYSTNTEWRIYHTYASNHTEMTGENLEWWIVSYTVYIKRNSLYHIYTLLMPCCVLSAFSCLLFLLPPDSGF